MTSFDLTGLQLLVSGSLLFLVSDTLLLLVKDSLLLLASESMLLMSVTATVLFKWLLDFATINPCYIMLRLRVTGYGFIIFNVYLLLTDTVTKYWQSLT